MVTQGLHCLITLLFLTNILETVLTQSSTTASNTGWIQNWSQIRHRLLSLTPDQGIICACDDRWKWSWPALLYVSVFMFVRPLTAHTVSPWCYQLRQFLSQLQYPFLILILKDNIVYSEVIGSFPSLKAGMTFTHVWSERDVETWPKMKFTHSPHTSEDKSWTSSLNKNPQGSPWWSLCSYR